MGTPNAMPVLQVQLGIGAPWAPPTSWYDITTYVQKWGSSIGRQHELVAFVAGTLNITLDNRDGRFWNWNTSGPYYPNLEPGMVIKITATWLSVTYNCFYGYIDSWTPVWSSVISTDMTVKATDAFGLMNVDTLSNSAYAQLMNTNSPSVYYKFTDLAGSVTAADSSGNGLTSYFAGTGETFGYPNILSCDLGTTLILAQWNLGNPTASDTFMYIPAAAMGTPANGNNYTICWWMETTNTAGGTGDGGSDTPATNPFLIWYTSGRTLGFQVWVGNLGYLHVASVGLGNEVTYAHNVADGKTHFVALNIAFATGGSIVTIYVDGALVATSGTITTLVPGNATDLFYMTSNSGTYNLSQFAVFKSGLSAATIAQLYQLGTEGFIVQYSGQRISTALANLGFPASLTNLDTGDSQVQAAVSSTLIDVSALSYIQEIAQSEQGLLYQDQAGVIQFRHRHSLFTTAAQITSQATFENSSGATYPYLIEGFSPLQDNIDLWNHWECSVQQGPTFGSVAVPSGAIQSWDNSLSQATYGRRCNTGNYSGLLMTSDTEALYLAQFLSVIYSTPTPRVKAIIMDNAINNGGNLVQMLGRNIADQVTVKYHSQVDTSTLTQPATIEGIEHEWTPTTWKTTFRTTPAFQSLFPWFILNDTVQGKLSSGNLLCY